MTSPTNYFSSIDQEQETRIRSYLNNLSNLDEGIDSQTISILDSDAASSYIAYDSKSIITARDLYESKRDIYKHADDYLRIGFALCPYPKTSDQHLLWMNGFEAAVKRVLGDMVGWEDYKAEDNIANKPAEQDKVEDVVYEIEDVEENDEEPQQETEQQ